MICANVWSASQFFGEESCEIVEFLLDFVGRFDGFFRDNLPILLNGHPAPGASQLRYCFNEFLRESRTADRNSFGAIIKPKERVISSLKIGQERVSLHSPIASSLFGHREENRLSCGAFRRICKLTFFKFP